MKFKNIFLISIFILICLSGCALATPVTNGLVAAYDYSHDSGNNVIDSSGNGNNGTNTGSTLIDVGNGHQYRTFLNSSHQSISVPTSDSLNSSTSTSKLTIEVWVNPSMLQSTTDSVYPLSKENAYRLKIKDPGTGAVLTFSIFNSTGSNAIAKLYPPILNNNWHQIVCEWDGVNQTMKLYDDVGLAYNISGSSVPSDIISNASPLSIGQHGSAYGYYNGSIGTIRIYNTTLSMSEIEQNYYNDLNNTYTDLNNKNPLSGYYTAVANTSNYRFLYADASGNWYSRLNTSNVYISSDNGTTQNLLFSDPDNAKISQIHKFDSGRILITDQVGKVYVSDTTGQNFQHTYTFLNTSVQTRASETFGMTYNGSRLWIADYTGVATQKSGQYIYQTLDEGQTFTVIYDAGYRYNFHFHDVKYDPYENLLWACTGDWFGNHFLLYTHVDPVTGADINNWHSVDNGNLIPQFTQIIPLPKCVLFVSDNPSDVRVYRWDRPDAGTLSMGNHAEPRLIHTIASSWNYAQAAYGSIAAINYGSTPYAVFGLLQMNDNQDLPSQLFATADGHNFYTVYDSHVVPANVTNVSSTMIGVLGAYDVNGSIYASIGDDNGDNYHVVFLSPITFASNYSNGIPAYSKVVSTTKNINNITYQWDFENDGKIDSTAKNLTHTYWNAGTYVTNLTIKSNVGNFSNTSTIVISQPTFWSDLTAKANWISTWVKNIYCIGVITQ